MLEEKKHTAQVAQKKTGHRFQEGHPRFGGKRKNTAAQARAMAEEMGVDPLAFLLSIIGSDVIEQTVIVDGKKSRVEVAVSLDTRMDAAKQVMAYMYPRLMAQQITGTGDGPLEVATLDVTKLLQDPAMAAMAQDLAISLALSESPTGELIGLTATERDRLLVPIPPKDK